MYNGRQTGKVGRQEDKVTDVQIERITMKDRQRNIIKVDESLPSVKSV
jgi:hypothetical protein